MRERSPKILLCGLAVSLCLAATQDLPAEGETPTSPRLQALLHEIERGDAGALGAFWQSIEQEGAPLVENIEGNDQQLLLTFIWRDQGDTKNVILFSPLTTRPNKDFTVEELARSHLQPLPDTDIWYRSFRVRRDYRLSYYISHNDSLLPFKDRKTETDWASLQPDPLNPKRYELVHETQVWTRSAVDGPGAEPVPWVEPREDTPRGRVEEHSMASEQLGHDRPLWVYTPAGYSTEGRAYNFLLLFDGWQAVHMEPTVTVLDNLLAAGEIEPTVAVMVGQLNRMAELTCNEPFIQFLIRELLPWVRENYHVSSDPARTIVGGGSAGGLSAVCVAWQHPDVFGNVISQSGYFSWDPLEATADADVELEWEWIIRKLAASPTVDIRLVLSVGIFEHDHDFLYSPSFLQANRHMRDVLLAKGYPFTYLEVAGGHDIYSGTLTFPGLLIEMSRMMPRNSNAEDEVD